MIKIIPYLPRNPQFDDPEQRHLGITSLPKNLLPRNEARKIEAERDAEEERQRCQDALDFAATSSKIGGLPFNENSKIALQALGTGSPKALQITEAGMKLANGYLQRNPKYLTDRQPVAGGTVGKVNFGAGAMTEGTGDTINGPRPDPLGALLGNASVMVDADGKIVGISDQFDYDPSNHHDDWMTAMGMGIVNDRITRDCAGRVPYVPIAGGRPFSVGGEKK